MWNVLKNDQQIVEFCQERDKNYKPMNDIKAFYHPVSQLRSTIITMKSVMDPASNEYDGLLQNMMKVLLNEHENVLLRQRDKELIKT